MTSKGPSHMRTDQSSTLWCMRAATTIGVLLVCSMASAQSGAIGGVVKDSSGGVMPGVTVEASSPALIEKVRNVTTDAAGQYKIVNLPVGVYKVTFTLEGFASTSLDQISLTSGFTATANGEMRPGTIEETLTVSGLAPVVDVQNVTVANVLTRETLDAVPAGKYYADYGILIPGMTAI